MRTSGRIANVGDLETGDHVCLSFRSLQQFRGVVSAHVAAGLARRERIAVFCDDYAPEDVVRDLMADGLDASRAVSDGQLLVLPARAAYLLDGRFEADRMVEAFSGAAAQARQDGWEGLRAIAESSFALDAADVDDYLAYEFAADALTREAGMIGVCAYDVRVTPAAALSALEAVHSARMRVPPEPRDIAFWFSAADDAAVLEGAVDPSCADALRASLRAVVASAEHPVIDMSRVRFVDVSGLRTMAETAARLHEQGRSLTLRALRPTARTALALIGTAPGLRIA